jgi:putative nucleotidyltransferase with HDIG domain
MNIETLILARRSALDEPGRLARLRGARRVLRQLDVSYGRVSPGPCYWTTAGAARDVWLTSGLLYFVAAADPRNDLVAHSRSAARYAVLLARAVGIDGESHLLDIERGALLHDVGKAALPADILRKNAPLTALEREIIRDHPVVGYRMIEEFEFLRPAAEIVLYHHERFDGRGYPSGLAGEAIPLGARILALADTLDALTSDRSYRVGRSFEAAIREIETAAGYQFDPTVAEVFLSVPLNAWRLAVLEAPARFRQPLAH